MACTILKTFNELDYHITTKEIQQAIKKLKPGSSPGLALISNAMLKAGQTESLHPLEQLFNKVLSSGIYPIDWTRGYITPIFKAKDPKSPDNYRGIAVTPCLGKLFNGILNARLDMYLENNHLISDCQIGFSKKSRTSDHMFVLKYLIDKYIHSANKKLFACFIDFRKAFDTVIHTGIMIKLLDMHIWWTFFL